MIVGRRRLARIAAALAASLSVGALVARVAAALAAKFVVCRRPSGPHCCSSGCPVVCRRR